MKEKVQLFGRALSGMVMPIKTILRYVEVYKVSNDISFEFVYVPNKQVAELGDRTVTVKSILNIMAAGIKCGTEVEVRCDGENEEADLKTLVDLIESGLGE